MNDETETPIRDAITRLEGTVSGIETTLGFNNVSGAEPDIPLLLDSVKSRLDELGKKLSCIEKELKRI